MANTEAKIRKIAQQARAASYEIAILPTAIKNALLQKMADRLTQQKNEIQKENNKDLKAATKKKLNVASIDRLKLSDKVIGEMAKGLREVAALPDPVGEVVKRWTRPNGLQVSRVRIPLGVIGMIYESRPNVTVDAAGLCLKSGNAIVLRGGSEAIHSNIFLGRLLRQILEEEKLNPNMVQVLPTTDRESMKSLVKQVGLIDLMIPRGGSALMKWMEEHSKVPVVKHDKGVCHVYVDAAADLKMAEEIVYNAKVQRPGVCNALETLLVHEKVAPTFLPALAERLREVELRGDAKTRGIISSAKKATEKDWSEEYLDLILAVRVVPNLSAAIEHIEKYGSKHTETIVTEDQQAAETFLRHLDSSGVFWNCSTRFNDGGQLGLGAEIGISTTKLHAFGPMGLEELTTTKFVVKGTGQTRT